MKRSLLYALVAGAFIFNSCKKNELPKAEETESSPVFYLRGDVNGVPVNIQAGIDGYYMNSSYYLDKNNVYVYQAELKQNACTSNCGFALEVLINDYKFSGSNSVMKVDSGLKAGSYVFNAGSTDPTAYTCNFSPLNPQPDNQYEWKFSDGPSITSGTASRSLKANTTYCVTLSSNDPKGCIISHTNVFKTGNPLQTNIRSSFQGGKYRFFVQDNLTASPPYNYHWDFGDGATSTDASPEHSYTAQDYYRVKLTLTDSENDSCVSYFQVNTANDCEANFIGTFQPVQNVKALSAITVRVTGANGEVYSSSDLSQSASSNFEILSVEDYRVNERQEATKKVKIRFNCNLNSSSGPLTINNGEAVIAVSYK